MADLIFRHLTGADGEGVYKNGKTGFSVSYFKKKEIDSRYPSGGYTVVGQIGKGVCRNENASYRGSRLHRDRG